MNHISVTLLLALTAKGYSVSHIQNSVKDTKPIQTSVNFTVSVEYKFDGTGILESTADSQPVADRLYSEAFGGKDFPGRSNGYRVKFDDKLELEGSGNVAIFKEADDTRRNFKEADGRKKTNETSVMDDGLYIDGSGNVNSFDISGDFAVLGGSGDDGYFSAYGDVGPNAREDHKCPQQFPKGYWDCDTEPWPYKCICLKKLFPLKVVNVQSYMYSNNQRALPRTRIQLSAVVITLQDGGRFMVYRPWNRRSSCRWLLNNKMEISPIFGLSPYWKKLKEKPVFFSTVEHFLRAGSVAEYNSKVSLLRMMTLP